MIYLDSNVFIYACLSSDAIGERSRNLLRGVERGEVDAASSTLSFDEIVWAVKKYRTMEQAISAGEAFINMLKLSLVPVDETVVRYAIEVMKRYGFDPRDSIHTASAILCRAEALMSSDPHFDRLKELQRRQL